jgi:tetratricopeptide (TPR) repeat protein
MSDDPQSTAPRRKPPADDSPSPSSDAPPLDTPAEAYASEEDPLPPEQEEAAQADEIAESYEETSHFADADEEQPPLAEGEAIDETQEPDAAAPPVDEEPPSYEEVPPPHDPAPIPGVKSIAPRHTARPAQMRSAPGPEPQTPDNQILALTYQLQELIAQKQSGAGAEAEENHPVAPAAKSRRPSFKPLGPPAALRNSALQHPPNQPSSPSPLQSAPTKSPTGPPSPGMDWPMRLAVGLVGLCLLAGVFVAGRVTSSVGVNNAQNSSREDAGPYIPPVSNPWSEKMLSQLDAILTADLTGDVDQAYHLASDLRTSTKSSVPGLNAYLANVETRRGNYREADTLLATGSDQGVLSTNDQFAFNYTRQRDFAKAAQWFTRAVTENPFSAEGFYRLGETLRRQGNLLEAMKRLKAALVRIPSEPMFDTQREWVAFKLRLAQIEVGQTADLQADIDAHLQVSPLSGYWLMTAAAAALQAGDQLAATVALDKAKSALTPEQFKGLLNDYFFRAYATLDRMGPYYTDNPAIMQRKQKSRTAYFIDP